MITSVFQLTISNKMASCRSMINLILIIIVFPFSITAQRSSTRNITLGSSIVANSDNANPTWTSPSGQFAFGFRQVAGGGFLLAIWFDQIPEKTVVWSANRDEPVPSGSTVQLSAQGMLELIDERRRLIWDANPRARAGTVAYGAMLDTGNLVLATNTSTILWQSFDFPTDTLLPGQQLDVNGVLVTSFSETNYSRGRFKLTNNRSELGLYTRSFPWDDSIYPYWLRSSDSPLGFSLFFNRSGGIYRATQNGTIIGYPFDSPPAPVENFVQRLTLEYDGVFRHYLYPKSANSTGGREMVWSVHDFIPENICMGVISGGNGGGICGFNSLCSFGSSSDGRPICTCPKGYVPIDPTDRMSGCRPDFALQSCDPQSQDVQNFEFGSEFINTNWPYSDYRAFQPVDEDFCRQDCLADCLCALATYTNGRCWKKQLPFINGRTDPSIPEKALVKIRKNGTIAKPPGTDWNNKTIRRSQSKSLFITGSVLLGTSVLVFLLSFVFYLKQTKPKIIPEARVVPAGMTTMTSFSFHELQQVTDGFKDELGRGACSIVYRGDLKDGGRVVAVKKLDKIAQESDLEFIAEVSSISRTNHKNLVQLLGYCDEGQHRILVYEFMTNGSLANVLFEDWPQPNWYKRVQIAFAIARGLCYLHEDCPTPIIHCDIKPQNVLLDESYTPKIADFGLAKLLRADQTRTTTGIRGTRGYVAPEWFRNMPITVKVDVYSFGILLLELLCCRRNYEADVENEGEVVLCDWCYDCYQQGALDLLVAGDEEAKSDMKMVERFVWTAIWCIQEDPTLRPHMKRVMHMLEGSIQVPAPPDPATFIA